MKQIHIHAILTIVVLALAALLIFAALPLADATTGPPMQAIGAQKAELPAQPGRPEPPTSTGAGTPTSVPTGIAAWAPLSVATGTATPTSTPCVLVGDFDDDKDVDVDDIMEVAGKWRMTDQDPEWDARYDLDSDGIITIIDIMLVVVHWGETCG